MSITAWVVMVDVADVPLSNGLRGHLHLKVI